MFFMFIIAKQSIINIRSDTDLQNAKNLRKFEFRGYALRITLNVFCYSLVVALYTATHQAKYAKLVLPELSDYDDHVQSTVTLFWLCIA